MILVVVLLDTVAFIAQLVKVLGCVVSLPRLTWLGSGYVAAVHINRCIQARYMLGLGWIDLENYESMHNLVAAVFQSLPTVILNSVIFSLGNKPSHGIFLSNRLFVSAIVASCLAMLRCLIVVLWQAYKTKVSVLKYMLGLSIGFTLAGNKVQESLVTQPSAVELLVQQYQNSGSAPLGNPNSVQI